MGQRARRDLRRAAIHVVSIMEFEEGMVVRETQYFGEPFEAGSSRAQWAEPIG